MKVIMSSLKIKFTAKKVHDFGVFLWRATLMNVFLFAQSLNSDEC